MENSATSRICTYDQDQTTSFHRDSSWTSSMDDLFLFDYSNTSSYDDQNAAAFSNSSYEAFQSRLCSSAASHGGAHPSASSHPKRRKVAPTVADDDLEDTATSPPHPAISSKGKGSEEEYGEVEDRIEVGFVGRDNNCSTGLKNIGLCLVPVSMAVNYFG